MRRSNLFLVWIACLSLILLSGCQLARTDLDTSSSTQNRLIGVFLTPEHLDLYNVEEQIEEELDHILSQAGDTENLFLEHSPRYEQRLYAKLVERVLTDEKTGIQTVTWEYQFENLQGVGLYAPYITQEGETYMTSISDPAWTDPKLSISYRDEGETLTIESTVCVCSQTKLTWYCNPVYQDAAGNVFLTSGSRTSFSGVHNEGDVYSFTLSTNSTRANRESSGRFEKETVLSDESSVTIHFKVLFPPKTVVLYQYRTDGTQIGREKYAAGEVPEKWVPEADTAYLVVQSCRQNPDGGDIFSYDLICAGTDHLTTYAVGEMELCIPQNTQILWPQT